MSEHWSSIKEKGNVLGIKLMLYSYRFVGFHITYILMIPVMFYYYLFSKSQRKASKTYLKHMNQYLILNRSNSLLIGRLSSFKHFLAFGEHLLDKLSVWSHQISLDKIDFPNKRLFLDQVKQKNGGVIFTAHLGNIEIARALSSLASNAKINALVFSEHAIKFNQVLKALNPSFDISLIHINQIDIPLAIQLKEKVEQGEFIVIAADRTSVMEEKRSTKALFLNHNAYFPDGAFILAHLLSVKSYFMLCVKEKRQNFKIIYEPFEEKIDLSMKYRKEHLVAYAKKYSDYLSYYCALYPYQWFNFYDFWQQPVKRDPYESK
ncbi:acyltransferase [Thiotrichales bacterium 19S11-10]|nr:acyltransferase [Thiotrichales bacterium 19S11-10]